MSKISELSDGGSLVSSDYLIAVRSGGNVKVRMDQINVDQIDLGDNEFIRLGNSQDLTIVHDASNSIINQAGIGDLLIQKAGTTKASVTANGLEFPDSSKAIFGAGSDLQIYHSGSHSFISEAGTGDLYIGASNNIALMNAAFSENKLLATTDGALTLYHDGSAKLATTATGVDVTGTVTATKLVSANGVLELDDNGTHNGVINAPASLFINIDSDANNTGEDFVIGKDRTGTSGGTELFRVQEDGNVGIGTSTATSIQGFAKVLKVEDAGSTSIVVSGDVHEAEYAVSANGGWFGTSTNIPQRFVTNNTERMRIDSNGNTTFKANNSAVGPIVTLENTATAVNGQAWGSIHFDSNDSSTGASGTRASIVGTSTSFNGDGNLTFSTAPANGSNTERMRLDSSGKLLVGKTASDYAVEGVEIRSNEVLITKSTTNPLNVRNGQDGGLIAFASGSSTVGSIGTSAGHLYVGNGDTNLIFNDTANSIYPWDSSANDVQDATVDLGASTARFKDLYRSGSTISTSDRNMKQDERDLTEAETRVAQACKGLLKAFRFIDAVQVDGDDARIHFGIIAQDLQAAFEAEGLDATKYAMFRPSTFTNDEGNEETRLGVCYENLLAFIIAAI